MTLTEVLRRRVAAARDAQDRTTALLELASWLSDADPRAAVDCAEEAFAEAERLNDTALIALAHRTRAHSLLFAVDPREAFEEFGRARHQFAALGDQIGTAWCDLLAGIALEYLGDPGGATINTERALAVFRAADDPAGQARALNTLGIGQSIIGRLEEGLTLLQRSGELAERAGDAVTLGLARLNAAEVRGRLGVRAAEEGKAQAAETDLRWALSELRAVRQHAVDTGFAGLEPAALAYQVVPLVQLGELDEAVRAGHAAIERAGAMDLDDAAAPALHYAGAAELANGDIEAGVAHLQGALALYEQWDLTHETVAVLRLLVQAQEKRGDIPAAFELHKRLLAGELRLRDGIAEREDQVAAARFEAERELQAAERGRRQLQQLARANRRLADERRAMERLAHTDALTSLANRRHFDAQLTRSLVQAELTNEPVSLVLVDIDHFKRVNDRYSHLAGDGVLRMLAAEIARHCRVSDLPARIGGEEFAVLLPGTGELEARTVAERLRTSVSRLDLSQVVPGLRITVSAGVACAHTGTGGDELLAAADAALYRAKRAGRNRVYPVPQQTAG